MKIYFIRHGETKDNVSRVWSSQTVELTEEGKEQVRQAAMQIPRSFSIIYSSDLPRTKQTTEIINKELNIPVVYDARLREVNIGTLEGKHHVDETEPEIRESYRSIKYDLRHLGGESVEDVSKRVLSLIEEIKMKHPKEEVLVVTSAGIIRFLHHTFHNHIPEKIHNASIHEFEFAEE